MPARTASCDAGAQTLSSCNLFNSLICVASELREMTEFQCRCVQRQVMKSRHAKSQSREFWGVRHTSGSKYSITPYLGFGNIVIVVQVSGLSLIIEYFGGWEKSRTSPYTLYLYPWKYSTVYWGSSAVQDFLRPSLDDFGECSAPLCICVGC